MKLCDLKDDNGTSLQSYADVLVEKAGEQGILFALIFVKKDAGKDPFDVITNIVDLPRALHGLANEMAQTRPSVTPVKDPREKHDGSTVN